MLALTILKRYKSFLVCVSLCTIVTSAFSQEIYTNKTFNFSIKQPESWITKDYANTFQDINDVEGRRLVLFSKFENKNSDTINPSILVTVRYDSYKTFKLLAKVMMKDEYWLNTSRSGITLVNKPETIEVNGISAVQATTSYETKSPNNHLLKFKKRTLNLVDGEYLYTIELITSQNSGTETLLFERAVQSIFIRK